MALQIDELSAGDRGVLRQASVMGVRFTRASLVAALELDEAGAEAILARLEGFLTADEAGGLPSGTRSCATRPTTGCRSAAAARCTAASASRSSSAPTATWRTSPAI